MRSSWAKRPAPAPTTKARDGKSPCSSRRSASAARFASSIAPTTPSTSSARIRRRPRGRSSATPASRRRSAFVPRRPDRTPTRRPPDGRGGALVEFAKGFPEDPELGRLLAAFESGDYRTVRDEAPKLAARTENPRVREAALDLRRRIDPDPIQLYMLGLTLALLVFLTAWFYSHGR